MAVQKQLNSLGISYTQYARLGRNHDQELCVFIPYSCGRVYKGGIKRRLKVCMEKHLKIFFGGKTMKQGISDHIWREDMVISRLWNEVKIHR